MLVTRSAYRSHRIDKVTEKSGSEDCSECPRDVIGPLWSKPYSTRTSTGASSLKKLIANSLIAVLCAGSAAPLVLCAQLVTVPACCRRDGKHRCMTAMSGFVRNSDDAAVFRNKLVDCPYRTHPSHLSGARSAPAIAAVSIPLTSTGGNHSQICPHRLLCRRLLKPSRGPPLHLLSTV